MRLPDWLIAQLGRPEGLTGRLVSRAMERANHAMALHAVGSLDLEPGHRVLDLGFGGGVAIALMLAHEPACRVVGVDPSETMVARARARFARAVGDGSLALHRGTAEELPLADASVDATLSNNTVYFWRDLERGLAELHRVLRPGGRLVLGINPPEHLTRAGFAQRGLRVLEPEALVSAVARAGFVDARSRRMPDPTEGTILVSASAAPR